MSEAYSADKQASAAAQSQGPGHVAVSDDWTRNWQARIAVKVAAMFIWILIAAAFAGLVYYTQDMDDRLEHRLQHDLDALSHRIQGILQLSPPGSAPSVNASLNKILHDELRHTLFSGIQLDFGDDRVSLGTTAGLDSNHRTLILLLATPVGEQTQRTLAVRLTAYHEPIAIIVERNRNNLILTVVLSLVVLGLTLIWVIHNVLSKPLQGLTNATQVISNGDLSLRLDTSRQDEFGHLSRFFNQMLDRVQAQQAALTDTNAELLQEVSIRKQAEAELRAHRDELEKLVEDRTKDLEIARDQALQASQTKSAFIANVSHEIRTPLTPIIGFAETMLQDDPDAETRKSLLASIIRNGRHLFNIINEILDLSKIEANKLEIEKIDVDVSQLFHDIESVIGMLAREKGLEFYKSFTSPVPRRIHSDPTRIKQILMNLLTNAIKFTEKGHVGLYLDYIPESKRLEFTVCDTGIGVPQDKQDRLFQAFSQADASTTRRFGGTGLGLYISQRLARLLGGDISVKSLEGVGTKFVISIPAEGERLDDLIGTPDAAAPPSYAATEVPTLIPRLAGHVLLAEDTPDNQRLISHYIGKTGARVSVAENGQVALEMAMANDYELILMDMQMPVMGGAEAVELLRASGCQIPIVALTANAMKGDRDNYTRIGCDDFLGKPIRQAVFYQTLARYLPTAGEGATPAAQTADAEFLEMQAGFQASLPGYVARLQTALEKRDYATLREEAHKLKGMGGSFGFPEITTRAASLESALKADQHEIAAPLCGQLAELLARCSDGSPSNTLNA